MKPLGTEYKNAKASTGDFKRLPVGGYIAKITAVEDKADKLYLGITYDIAMGEFEGFYSDEWGQAHPYAHNFVRSYKEQALGMFKGFLHAVDESNGTKFEEQAENGLDEKLLVGKRIGLVIGYEEYETDRGEVRERTRVAAVRSVDAIVKGDYKVPEVKKIAPAPSAPAGFEAINPDDVPF